MQLQTDRRSSPRIATNYSIKLSPDNIKSTMLNIGEKGICFDCPNPSLPKEVQLSMDSLVFNSKQSTEISSGIVWHNNLEENRSQYGVQFSSLTKENFSQIRDFIFDSFAKKASAVIKDNKDLQLKVETFFNKDVRQYHEDLSALVHEIRDVKNESKEIEERLTTLTNELLFKGNALEKIVDNNINMKKIKQIFRELGSCWIYKSPIMKMAYDKPRGYPGDYKLFEIIYENKPLSKNNDLGYYFDRYFLGNTYTMAVRTRKNKMKNILQDFIENTSLSSIRLLNIACGPSREIRELLSDPLLCSKKNIVFTGLDNDNEGLELSKSKLNNLPSNIELRFLNENVLDIFRDNKYYDIIGKQDIIYILGLTEYLPDRIFKKLIHFLSKLLNDKGMLVITYKDRDILFPSLPPDWFCDWAFIKRSKDDLINVADSLGSDKFSVKIEREGSGCIFFLILTKI